MQESTMRKLAKPMCLSAAIIWGSSFVVMKNAVDDLPIFWLLAVRFSAAALILAVLFYRKWQHMTADYIWRGAIIGAFLFSAYAVQTFGLAATTPSKNAFLTAVYCVIVPFLYWIAAKQKPDRWNIIAALLCVVGVGCVSLHESFSITYGDALTLVSALLYAAHIVAVAKVSPGKDIYLLTIFQFAFAGLYGWLLTLFFETPPAPLSTPTLFALIYLSVMATAVALLLQNVGQIYSDPSSAAVLLSLESVFGVLCGILFYGDPVTVQLVSGFVLIFIAVVCSETKFRFLPFAKQKPESNRER